MLRPQAVAGVVRPARVPTTPRWLLPAPPLLIQGRESCRPLISLCFSPTMGWFYISSSHILIADAHS